MLTFCGVNAHWQNGVAERKIRELQDHARTMLIHAKKRWPEVITANLWPYAIRQSNDILIESPRLNVKDPKRRGRSPLEIFSQVPVTVDPAKWHPFGCPAYVLDNSQQATGRGNKWSEHARIGMYIG